MEEEQPAFEVLTLGRVIVDIYPLEVGVPLQDVKTFGKFLGGSPTNVAVAAARFGRRAGVISRTGDDPFARFVHTALRQIGVDDRFVSAVVGSQTTVAFCEMLPPDDFPLWVYSGSKPPDLEIDAAGLDFGAIEKAGIFWATATGLSQEPSRSAHLAAWQARGRRGPSVLDLDYRAMMWGSPQEVRRHVSDALQYVSVAVGNLEETSIAVGESDPERGARALLDHGVDLAVIKQGDRGALAMTANETVVVPPYKVEVINGLGAGDAFGGALCHGLLSRWPLETVLRFASAAGAIVASRLECATAMPTTTEVEALMLGNARP
jgi:5-dehydro-2-deoxygluconokinase